ncbi:hypothetical protein AVEN_124286-1 [Araneus ventricosus]|uniref:Uncharacterized protein n=1 Tax=Araneus ventricosus TaxID=182803 RepID=A0A4Y2WHW4_ARAVE|nr:hypothetical protein AVEN_124286-1 [Araneus ventricosus]
MMPVFSVKLDLRSQRPKSVFAPLNLFCSFPVPLPTFSRSIFALPFNPLLLPTGSGWSKSLLRESLSLGWSLFQRAIIGSLPGFSNAKVGLVLEINDPINISPLTSPSGDKAGLLGSLCLCFVIEDVPLRHLLCPDLCMAWEKS